MRNAMTLDRAEYRTGQACSLFETIMDMAGDECSQQLLDLISMACDINHETHLALKNHETLPPVMKGVSELVNCAENALSASEEAMAVLSLWIDSIPYGDEYHGEACRVGAVMSLLHKGIRELVKVQEAYCAK